MSKGEDVRVGQPSLERDDSRQSEMIMIRGEALERENASTLRVHPASHRDVLHGVEEFCTPRRTVMVPKKTSQ